MAGASDIEWTEATWNPIAGCTILSPGCTNCYAQRLASRLQAMGSPKYQGTTRKSGRRHVWTGRVNVDNAALDAPLRWRRPIRIFVNSMSDLFQDNVSDEVITAAWSVMKEANWHTYQILTKRPGGCIQRHRRQEWPRAAVLPAHRSTRVSLMRCRDRSQCAPVNAHSLRFRQTGINRRRPQFAERHETAFGYGPCSNSGGLKDSHFYAITRS